MKLAIFGAAGRMGLAVARLAHADEQATIVGAIEAPDCPAVGRDLGELAGLGTIGVEVSADTAAGLLGAEIVVDFSLAPAFAGMLRQAARARVAVVSGTTRLGADELRALDEAARSIPVLWAPNMSLGIYVLSRLVEQAVGMLGPDYNVEIVEAHHRAKVDAPSGTAHQLVQAAQKARAELEPVYGRQGQTGARPTEQIGVHAVRGGGVIGVHNVQLLGALESLELTHRAVDRDLFAHGALRAAQFLCGRPPGRYDLGDVLDCRAAAAPTTPR